MAVARHVPSIAEAMAHHYSLNNADRLCALLQSAGFRSVETIMETRAFPFSSFQVYFEPFEHGGGPWGAAYANLPTDAQRAVREDVQHILSGKHWHEWRSHHRGGHHVRMWHEVTKPRFAVEPRGAIGGQRRAVLKISSATVFSQPPDGRSNPSPCPSIYS